MSLYNCCRNLIDHKVNMWELERLLKSYRFMNTKLFPFKFELIFYKEQRKIAVIPSCNSADIIRFSDGGFDFRFLDPITNTNEKRLFNTAINILDGYFLQLDKEILEVIYWRYIDNSKKDGKSPSNRELAKYLKISEGTLRYRIHKALDELICLDRNRN